MLGGRNEPSLRTTLVNKRKWLRLPAGAGLLHNGIIQLDVFLWHAWYGGSSLVHYDSVMSFFYYHLTITAASSGGAISIRIVFWNHRESGTYIIWCFWWPRIGNVELYSWYVPNWNQYLKPISLLYTWQYRRRFTTDHWPGMGSFTSALGIGLKTLRIRACRIILRPENALKSSCWK